MTVTVMKSKIHCMKVTASNFKYQGSLGVDAGIMEEAGMLPNEKVLVINESNNARYETYLIPRERGSLKLEVLGPGARDVLAGDKLIIIAFGTMTVMEAKEHEPKIVIQP